MKEIKFRQRNINNGKWYYWGLVDKQWINPILQDNYQAPSKSNQYTGLKDKNGNEIYKGDLLDCTGETFYAFRVGQPKSGKINTTIYEVLWHEDAWATKVIKSNISTIGFISKGLKITAGYSTVIGNIHDNLAVMEGME